MFIDLDCEKFYKDDSTETSAASPVPKGYYVKRRIRTFIIKNITHFSSGTDGLVMISITSGAEFRAYNTSVGELKDKIVKALHSENFTNRLNKQIED